MCFQDSGLVAEGETEVFDSKISEACLEYREPEKNAWVFHGGWEPP